MGAGGYDPKRLRIPPEDAAVGGGRSLQRDESLVRASDDQDDPITPIDDPARSHWEIRGAYDPGGRLQPIDDPARSHWEIRGAYDPGGRLQLGNLQRRRGQHVQADSHRDAEAHDENDAGQ
jgi:hypothetical protein